MIISNENYYKTNETTHYYTSHKIIRLFVAANRCRQNVKTFYIKYTSSTRCCFSIDGWKSSCDVGSKAALNKCVWDTTTLEPHCVRFYDQLVSGLLISLFLPHIEQSPRNPTLNRNFLQIFDFTSISTHGDIYICIKKKSYGNTTFQNTRYK